ncbi:uncharacterized protein LOC117123648 [Anneissia japonica]|uniref:uncharacterized protein LOC117123648 n=1 Tax=Anneissia japonica TaxID=1529436 RepID=UPI00142598E9|nr:uncharacterized protein LOC117123648 [Anneissia japonica]
MASCSSDEDIWDYKPPTKTTTRNSGRKGNAAVHCEMTSPDLRSMINECRRRGPRTMCKSRTPRSTDEDRLSNSSCTSAQEGVGLGLTLRNPSFLRKRSRPKPRARLQHSHNDNINNNNINIDENTHRASPGPVIDTRPRPDNNNSSRHTCRPKPSRKNCDKPKRSKQEISNEEEVNDGFCPNCQLPFRILKVQTPRWHLEECLQSVSKADKECPDGLDCESTIKWHYKNFTHSLLANLRAGRDQIDWYISEETATNIEKIQALFGPRKNDTGILNNRKVHSTKDMSKRTPSKHQKQYSQEVTRKNRGSNQSTPRKEVGPGKAKTPKKQEISLSQQPSILSFFKPDQPSINSLLKTDEQKDGFEKCVDIEKSEDNNELDMLLGSAPSSSSVCNKNGNITDEDIFTLNEEVQTQFGRNHSRMAIKGKNLPVENSNDFYEDGAISWSPAILSDCSTQLYSSGHTLDSDNSADVVNTKASPEDMESDEDIFSPLPRKTASFLIYKKKAKTLDSEYNCVFNNTVSSQSKETNGSDSEQKIFSPVYQNTSSNEEKYINSNRNVEDDDLDYTILSEIEDCGSGCEGDISEDPERMVNECAGLSCDGITSDQCEDFKDHKEETSTLVPKTENYSDSERDILEDPERIVNNGDISLVADKTTSYLYVKELQPKNKRHFEEVTTVQDQELINSEEDMFSFVSQQEMVDNSCKPNAEENEVKPEEFQYSSSVESLRESVRNICDADPGTTRYENHSESSSDVFFDCQDTDSNLPWSDDFPVPCTDIRGKDYSSDLDTAVSSLTNSDDSSTGSRTDSSGVISRLASQFIPFKNYFFSKNIKAAHMNAQTVPGKFSNESGRTSGAAANNLEKLPTNVGHSQSKTNQRHNYKWKSKNRSGAMWRSNRQCPFYKKMPETAIVVDAFSYGSIPGTKAYFLSHFHYDHYGGLTKNFQEPIYCSKLFNGTLYCSPEHIFPSQEDAIEYAVTISRKHVETNERTLIVCGTYTIGKEKIFLAIAEALRCKVCITKEKETTLKCLEDKNLNKFLTSSKQLTRLHVLPMSYITHTKLKEYMNQFPRQYNQVIGIKPTGWTYSKKGAGLLDIKPSVSGQSYIYGIPYSEHSSYDELERFVRFIKPIKIQPTVNVATEASRKKMSNIFDSWMKDAATIATKRKSTTPKIDFFVTSGKNCKN